MLNNEDNYILPKIRKKTMYVATRPTKRYIVDVEQVNNLYNEYAMVFDRLNE